MRYTIEAEGLTKAYGPVTVLRGLDLHVERGQVLGLLGPNGAGKTTAVRILSTLTSPDAGYARVAGYDVVAEREKVRRSISLTAQEAAIDAPLTARENLVMMARLRGLGRRDAARRTAELLEQFDLTGARDRRVGEFSGGMRRRLDLAIGLITSPPVIFLDEPTTGLDPRSRRAVWDAVEALAGTGATVLLTTQYLEEADRLADRVAVIDGGQVVAEGTADELKRRAGREAVELFFADDAAREAAVRALGTPAARDAASVRVPTDGSARSVRDLLDRLHAEDVDVERVELHRPTLDDVFLTLTAR
jgi:ABC-2 type transport system ATP-binding protein